MITIYEIQNPIAVKTPLGDAKAIFLIDYGPDINTVWKCRLDESGKVRNFYDDDIIIYPNPMNGEPQLT